MTRQPDTDSREDERHDQGYSLVELLIVVAIIGVLVAIAVPLYMNYKKGAENKSAESDLRNAVSSVENCIGNNGGKVPKPDSGTYVSATNRPIYLTCKSDGSGTASLTAPPAGTKDTETINVTDASSLNYAPNVSANTYQLASRYDTSADHDLYTYASSSGKIKTS